MEFKTARIVFAICAIILVGIISVLVYGNGFYFDFGDYLTNRNIRQ